MGYNTDFSGELKFKEDITIGQLAKVKTFLGEDVRDHKEWSQDGSPTYIELEISEDFSCLKWNGSEKTYNMVECVNIIIDNMRLEFPDFGLTGGFLANGEEAGDVWRLKFDDDGRAIEEEVVQEGDKIECPYCGEHFVLGES